LVVYAGGWFPIALACIIFIISAIWFYGRQRKNLYLKSNAQRLESILKLPEDNG
jgi:K+ transporter